MGREKFKKLTQEQKENISKKIMGKLNEITSIKKSFAKEMEIFDSVNDEMKDLFECDLNCSTCGEDDRGKCMQNFRLANIYLQKQTRHVIYMVKDYIDVFKTVIQELGYEMLDEIGEKKKVEKLVNTRDFERIYG